MQNLRSRLIRLASTNLDLRPHLLPLLVASLPKNSSLSDSKAWDYTEQFRNMEPHEIRARLPEVALEWGRENDLDWRKWRIFQGDYVRWFKERMTELYLICRNWQMTPGNPPIAQNQGHLTGIVGKIILQGRSRYLAVLRDPGVLPTPMYVYDTPLPDTPVYFSSNNTWEPLIGDTENIAPKGWNQSWAYMTSSVQKEYVEKVFTAAIAPLKSRMTGGVELPSALYPNPYWKFFWKPSHLQTHKPHPLLIKQIATREITPEGMSAPFSLGFQWSGTKSLRAVDLQKALETTEHIFKGMLGLDDRAGYNGTLRDFTTQFLRQKRFIGLTDELKKRELVFAPLTGNLEEDSKTLREAILRLP